MSLDESEVPLATVGDLADAIAGLPRETPFLIHFGWDIAITDSDVNEDGFVIYPDDSTIRTVSRDWLDAQTRGASA